MKGFIGSKSFIIAALILAAIIVVLLSFSLGVIVGLNKAKFSYRFGENYEKNFLTPHPMKDGPMENRNHFPPDFEKRGFRNAHGLAGTILSIAENNLVIKDKDDKENSIATSEKTIIKLGRETVSKDNLKTGDEIVVIGNPDENGTVQAEIIRIFEQENQQ